MAQVKYYLYLLKQKGIDGARGILEYPKLRNKEEVRLSPVDEKEIERWLTEIKTIKTNLTGPTACGRPFAANAVILTFAGWNR